MPNNALQEFLSKRFRRLLSGDPDGVPPWLGVVAAGEEGGLYLPTDAPWVVHADFGTLVGGIRALLMQALHPGSLAGVAGHSRYQQDALGRLSGTIRWLTVTTFGSLTAIADEAGRVNRMHDRVKGEYTTGQGEKKAYRAADPDLLLWVHIAFTDSFLSCHERYAWRPIPAGLAPTGADNYVAQWSKSVGPLGLTECPMDQKELNAEIARFEREGLLKSSEMTLRVVEFIKNPPLSRMAMMGYRLFFNAAVLSLPPQFRQMLGLRAGPRWIIQPLTRVVLRFMRFAIGPDSPIEDAAIARLRRIGKIS